MKRTLIWLGLLLCYPAVFFAYAPPYEPLVNIAIYAVVGLGWLALLVRVQMAMEESEEPPATPTVVIAVSSLVLLVIVLSITLALVAMGQL